MEDPNNANWLKGKRILSNLPSKPGKSVQPATLFAHPSRGLAAPKRDESTKIVTHEIPQNIYEPEVRKEPEIKYHEQRQKLMAMKDPLDAFRERIMEQVLDPNATEEEKAMAMKLLAE